MYELFSSKRFSASLIWMIISGLSTQFGWDQQTQELFVAAGTALVGLLVLGWSAEEFAGAGIEGAERVVNITPTKWDDMMYRQAFQKLQSLGVITRTRLPTDPPDPDGKSPYTVDLERFQSLIDEFLHH